MHTSIITGVNGFVGHHLARELKNRQVTIIGVGNGPLDPALEPLVDQYFRCDLTKLEDVKKLPFASANSIINLAGLANVGASFSDPKLYEKNNTSIVENIGEELLAGGGQARFLAISTGAVYDPTQTFPFTEASRLVDKDHTSPYAKSKLIMEEAANKLDARGVNCIIVRPFNHVGPGQKPGFLLPDLAARVLTAIDSGSQQITVGNLQSRRDYTDVRDVVKAYASLALAQTSSLHSSVYNVCSGVGLTGQAILDELLAALGSPTISVKTSPELMRSSDPEELVGDHSVLSRDTGWQPEIPIEQTVKDFVGWLKKD